jgi:hypothetical protein
MLGVPQWRGKHKGVRSGKEEPLEEPRSEAWWAWLFLCQVSAVFSAAAKTGMTLTGMIALEVLHAAAKGWRDCAPSEKKNRYVDLWNGYLKIHYAGSRWTELCGVRAPRAKYRRGVSPRGKNARTNTSRRTGVSALRYCGREGRVSLQYIATVDIRYRLPAYCMHNFGAYLVTGRRNTALVRWHDKGQQQAQGSLMPRLPRLSHRRMRDM